MFNTLRNLISILKTSKNIIFHLPGGLPMHVARALLWSTHDSPEQSILYPIVLSACRYDAPLSSYWPGIDSSFVRFSQIQIFSFPMLSEWRTFARADAVTWVPRWRNSAHIQVCTGLMWCENFTVPPRAVFALFPDKMASDNNARTHARSMFF